MKIFYPLPGAVCSGLVEGKEDDDVYKGWDMVEIAHKGWEFDTLLLFSVGGLSYVVVSWFFSRFHPFEFPSVHPFFLRRENLEFMQY